jgi:exosortase/archaeosortase family protein
MKQSVTPFVSLHSMFSSMRMHRADLFLILVFAPLPVIIYYNPFGSIISFYGFLILLIKRQKLLDLKEASRIQRILGLVVVVSSFFIYYAAVLVYPNPAFYEVANYVLHLLGSFLIFFEFSALREAVAPLILIIVATSTSFISAWLKPLLSPIGPSFAQLVVSILRTLGINASTSASSNAPIINFSSLTGKSIISVFSYECLGVSSTLIFSVILIVIMLEDPSTWKTRLICSTVGLICTFALNILRVEIIFLTDYFFGEEMGADVHYIIGYTLFSIWLASFFYIYSKRQTLRARIISFGRKFSRYARDQSAEEKDRR